MGISVRAAAILAAICSAASPGGALRADPGPARPVYTADGLVHVPAFDLPPSAFASKEAVNLLKSLATTGLQPFKPTGDVAEERLALDTHMAPGVDLMRAKYPADITETTIAGIPVRIFTPKAGVTQRDEVLINVHGGGFVTCANACSLLESLPIASIGGYKVVSVNYRMGPEAVFPAATEDVTAVYQELLKTHKPKQIGLYGCSAGGALSGQVAAWLPAHGLPEPGAIGIFGSGAGRWGPGDSNYISSYIDGSFPPPPPPGAPPFKMPYRSYFEGANMSDPLVSPMLHLDVLAKFPPTLVITGTRAADLSPAVFTHSQLLKAGVPAELVVGEGMSHCYMYMPQLPEAQDAYQTIVRFFHKNLS